VLDFASPTEWAVAAGIVFVGGAVQGTIGIGLAILSVPVLTLLDPTFVPEPIQLVAVVAAISQLVRERRALDVRGAAFVLAGRVPGAALGLLALSLMSERSLSIVVGVVVLVGVLAMARGWSIPITRPNEVLTGMVSGAMGLSTGVGGPPLGMLYRSRSGPSLRATLGAVFTIGLAINLTTLAVAGRIGAQELAIAGALVVPLGLGFAVSGTVARRATPEGLRLGVLVVSAIAAVTLLVSVALS
jgi:hypothetical protein